uniref:hypothetical protein n=1 Tax=Acinetobacter variabilis TaxID=70346 RepID=UPI0028991147
LTVRTQVFLFKANYGTAVEKTLLSKRRVGWIKKNRVEAIQHDFFIFIGKKIFKDEEEEAIWFKIE